MILINSKFFSLQFLHLLRTDYCCCHRYNARQTVAAPAFQPGGRMLEFIDDRVGRRGVSERLLEACLAEERARFYIFQS
ncbi:hypothetical protein FHL81_17860 [Agrobacterium tumefaciens]|jgi:hypothetical protein|nr:hypothetical protein ATCR1_07909 [Agrobacterium tumefaciens CCNWGS0286]KAA1233305.1 hypothetical protein FHL81_17860 [Agrobacterium tumefaciens]KWT85636.1 hypothetical protein ASB65_24670 [Agrobacterium tumefaciens str. B6]TGE77582.1 hypothetical protein C9410_20970 [Rhizobium sp. SEMIA 439]MQB26224.1 hypothetical protein [Agrobacterium tumefaciens]